MAEGVIGFIIWCMIAVVFMAIGIGCLFAKTPVGFWANSNKQVEVTDVKAYNKAMCILWIVFAVVLILLGLPLLAGQNSPLIIISVFGVFVEIIILMLVYVFVIEKKYRKNV